jgi:hypothetical protein
VKNGLVTNLRDGLWFPGVWVSTEENCTCSIHKKKHIYKLKVKWIRKLSFLSLNIAVNENIYQQEKQLITTDSTT